MSNKCFNKNNKEYKTLLAKYKSDAVVNAVIEKYQYNKGTDEYPTIEESEEIVKDKSFTNYSIINNLKNSLNIRLKTLKKELNSREINNRVYVSNKTKIDKLLRTIENTTEEKSFVMSIEFANNYLKDINDALNDGRVGKASIETKTRFLSDASKYLVTYNNLRFTDSSDFTDNSKKLKSQFVEDLVILEKRIQEEKKDAWLEVLNSGLLDKEKETVNFTDILTGEIQDINNLEFNFGALATSTNPVLAIVDRLYKSESDNKRLEFETDYKEFIDIAKEYQKVYGDDYSFMFNVDNENNIQNKYIVSEINYKFYESRANMMKLNPTVDDNGDKIKYKIVSKNDKSKEAVELRNQNLDLKNKKKNRSKWFKENTEYTSEFNNELSKFINAKYILEKKVTDLQGEILFTEYNINPNLTKEQYNQVEYFIESQYEASVSYKLDKFGNVTDIIDPYTEDGKINNNLSGWKPKNNNFRPKLDKWTDEKYTNLINSKDLQAVYYQTYKKFYEKYGNKVPEYSYKGNELIAMQRNWIDSVIDNPSIANIKNKLFGSNSNDNLTNIKRDENGNIIPAGLKLLYTGSIEENLKDKINALETQKQKASTQEEIDKIDLKLSKLYSSVDLSEINTNMTESLLNYMSMASKYELKHSLEKKLNIVQDVISDTKAYSVDYFTGKIRPTSNRIATRIQDFINTRIYDETRADRDLISSKIIDTVSKITSVSGLGLALKPALGNTITATFNNFIEGFGGQFYNVKEYLKGKSLATANAKALITNLTNGQQTKVNALMDRLGLFEKFNPVNPEDVVEKLSWKSKMTTDIAFILQNASEYYVQSSVALAMMQSHRLVNGEILNEGEYRNIYKDDNFNNYSTIWDNIDFIDNTLIFKSELNNLIKENKIEDQLFLFSQRIIGVNQKIHGRYTADDASRLQQFALGRMFQQFKRWVSSAVEERFTKKHYDYRLRTDIEGRYVTMYRLISKINKEGIKAVMNWNNLTELEKSNIKKMTAELSAIMVTAILAYLAKKAAEDMDDEDEYYLRKLTHFGAYMGNRTYSELTTFYRPNILLTASNAPVLGTIKELGEFSINVLFYPIYDENKRYYSRGTNKGRLKIEKEFGDLVPIWKDVSFFNSLDTQGDYYFSIK
jgi:hypothetical protein